MLRSDYCILFHHLSPMIQEPIEFLSYGTGSLKAQVLQEEVDEILLKSAMEIVSGGACFLFRLFVVEKTSGSWRFVADVCS